MPAEVDLTLPLPGLSPVCGKPVIARFDGGRLSETVVFEQSGEQSDKRPNSAALTFS